MYPNTSQPNRTKDIFKLIAGERALKRRTDETAKIHEPTNEHRVERNESTRGQVESENKAQRLPTVECGTWMLCANAKCFNC